MATKESQVNTEKEIIKDSSSVVNQTTTISNSEDKVRVYNPNRFQVMFEYDGEMTPLPPKSFSSLITLNKIGTPLPLQLRVININNSTGGK